MVYSARAIELQETKYCMPYPTPVFKQHYMLQELGMACNTWFLVVLSRARLVRAPDPKEPPSMNSDV